MHERVLVAAGIALAGCQPAPPPVTMPNPAPAPMAAPLVAPRPACVPSAPADPAIGIPIGDPYDLLRQAHGRVGSVVSRPGRIEIATVVGDIGEFFNKDGSPQVELSSDGGTTFTTVLDRGHGFPRVVIDCTGQLFVARNDSLGIRTVAGAETFQTFPFPSRGGDTALYEVSGTLVWFHGDAIGVSVDGGASWHQTPVEVARELAGIASDHRFVVAGGELDRVTWVDDRMKLARFDPLHGTVTHEPIDVAYDNDVPWIDAVHAGHRWAVHIRCRSKPTASGQECLPPPSTISRDDNEAVSHLLPRLVAGSSPGDLPTRWCRSGWVGGEDCVLLTVRDGVVTPEPYSGNGGWTGRKLPQTPTVGFALPDSFVPGWIVGFDGDGHPLAMFGGYLMRWSAASGWRVLPVGIDSATATTLTVASTPIAPEPSDHPLAQALRDGFGADVWRCAGDCTIALSNVRCSSHGRTARCEAVDNANGDRKVVSTATAAEGVAAALTNDIGHRQVATVACSGHSHLPAYPSVHCRIVGGDGDDIIDGAIAAFEVSSLGQHSRTPAPVTIRCSGDTCVLAGQATISGNDAAALSHVLATRRGARCGAGTCRIEAAVTCESTGGFADGGLTHVLTCSVRAP
jgi:hypothetical protein